MRTCPTCGGARHNLKMVSGRVTFEPCCSCDAQGTIASAPPLAAHIVVTTRQLKVAGNANAKRRAA